MYASDEALASFFARPEWPAIRATLLILGHREAVEEIDRTVERVRREIWKDFSDR